MYFLKNFFSHILAIIFFIAVFLLSGTFAVRELITHDHLYNALEKTNYMDEIEFKEGSKEQQQISQELLEYVEIEDIINHYVADKVLYEFNIIDTEPKIDIDELNSRLATALEEYLDDKIDEYSGGLNSFLEENGIDLKIKDKVENYINNNTSIDLTNEKIITEKDLEDIYKKTDDMFLEVKEGTYLQEIINIIYNDKLPIILILVIIATFTLISLINFNILTGLLYTIAPFAINTIIYLVGFYGLKEIKFTGGIEVEALNYFKEAASSISFICFILFILLTITVCLLYYIGKHINILISHKTGKTTLDTIFDDYDSEGVVKKLQEQDEEEKE